MADLNGNGTNGFKEAVCVNAARIYDSCSDKDCLEDLQVYFTDLTQPTVDSAVSVKCRGTEVLNVLLDVEPVPFNKGFYAVDMTFFFKVYLDAYLTTATCPTAITGLAVFSKKVILYGSEGSVKAFSSDTSATAVIDPCSNRPTNAPRASVQVVNPICLACQLIDYDPESDIGGPISVPPNIAAAFDGSFVGVVPIRTVLTTVGLFSICQLERQVQMMMPVYDFCLPDCECPTTTDDPCELFGRIKFPVNEFFPPKLKDMDCQGDLSPSDLEC